MQKKVLFFGTALIVLLCFAIYTVGQEGEEEPQRIELVPIFRVCSIFDETECRIAYSPETHVMADEKIVGVKFVPKHLLEGEG